MCWYAQKEVRGSKLEFGYIVPNKKRLRLGPPGNICSTSTCHQSDVKSNFSADRYVIWEHCRQEEDRKLPFHDSEAEKCSLITLRTTFFSSFPDSLPQLPGKRRGWGKKVCEGFLKWAGGWDGGKVCACVLSSRSKVGGRGGVGWGDDRSLLFFSFDAVTSLHSRRVRTAVTTRGELRLNYPKYTPVQIQKQRERNHVEWMETEE